MMLLPSIKGKENQFLIFIPPPSSLIPHLYTFACRLVFFSLRMPLTPLFTKTVTASDARVYPFEFFINDAAHTTKKTLLEFGEAVRYILRQDGIRGIAQITQRVFDRAHRAVRRFICAFHNHQTSAARSARRALFAFDFSTREQ
jgi:hypothetical protein